MKHNKAVQNLLIVILVVSIFGILLSGYTTWNNIVSTGSSFCDINETFSCDAVNNSKYATFLGVKVSILGIIGYAFITIASTLYLRKPEDKALKVFLGLMATGAFGFSLYLTSIEAFVLEAWCLLCIGSQALAAIIFGSTVWLWFASRDN